MSRTPWPCRARWFGWVEHHNGWAAFFLGEALRLLMKVWPHRHDYSWGNHRKTWCVYCEKEKP